VSEAVAEKINGISITDMRDVLRALTQHQDGFQVIEIDEHRSYGTCLILRCISGQRGTT
jgi:hypothetical protein